jgi:uncharacterized protein YjbJ (UPF0337 family)
LAELGGADQITFPVGQPRENPAGPKWPNRRCFKVGLGDKIDNKTDELKGKTKEQAGKATEDRDLEAEGHRDQAKGNLKQAGEKIKDVFKS